MPKAPFGAVIAGRERREVAARGFNKSKRNSIWHGEIVATNRRAAGNAGIDGMGLTPHTTAERCLDVSKTSSFACVTQVR